MKKHYFFIGIVSVLIIFSTISGIIVRNSLIDDIDFNKFESKMDDLIVTYIDKNIYEEYFDIDIDKYKDIENKSNYILKVKLSGNRERLYATTLSEVKIIDVYKGESLKKGQKIYIYEPSYIADNLNYYTAGGYNLMNANEEYIVFLNTLKIPPSYEKKGKNKNAYMFTTLQFSKYKLDNNMKDITYNISNFENGDIKYIDIKKSNIIIVDKTTVKKYNSFKEKVQEYINDLK